jgi:hypothetical protein
VVVTVYYRGQVVGNGGSSYVCILDHTSSASDEPGVGGSWTTYWAVVAAAGTGLTTGDKGDITVSAGGATWTIDNDAVTYAKIQNVSATDRLLGRSTAGAGDIEEIACTAAGRAILDDVDAAAQRTTLGLGTLATQSGTFSGTSSGTNTGDQTITLTGDVTGSGTGSFAATIANDAVTYAKIQNVSAASRLLGRGDSGSGDVQEITLGSGLSMTGTTLAATGGGVTDGDKGDITVSASGATWTIDHAAVTFAKMQDITSHHLVGRHAGSTGAPQEVGVGNGVEFHGSGIRRSQLLGDVEASAGSNTTTIATGAVTLSKMANLATDTLIGRQSPSTGVPETISCTAAGRALIDDADAASQRTTLGLGSAATQNISSGTASPTGGADGDIYLQYV